MYYFENINHVNVLKRIPQPCLFPSSMAFEPAFNTADEYILQALRYYVEMLRVNTRAIEYLKLRKIYDPKVINIFHWVLLIEASAYHFKN